MFAVKARIMENMEKDYTYRNIHILSDSQRALDSFLLNSKLVWDCHQSMLKLAECNRIQLVWVPKHKVMYGNQIADELAKESASHSLTQPGPALGISADVGRRVIWDWTSKKRE
jgi:ribonuclease HI